MVNLLFCGRVWFFLTLHKKYNLLELPSLYYTRRNIIQKIHSVCIKKRRNYTCNVEGKNKNDRWQTQNYFNTNSVVIPTAVKKAKTSRE